MIAVNTTVPVGRLNKHDLQEGVYELINQLFTLTGKYSDSEKMSMFAQHLADELPVNYPTLTLADIKAIFNKAILGDFGALNSIRLADIYQWLRKASHAPKNVQRIDSSVLVHPNTSTNHPINWEKQCFLAYQVYLNQGLRLEDFHYFIYDRMMMDNFIKMNSYCDKLDKVAHIPDEFERVTTAKKMVVINTFELFKREGRPEIYSSHKHSN